jgi:ribonuclease R
MSKKKLKKTKEKSERKTRREKSADFKRRPSSAGSSKNQSNKNQNSRSIVVEGTVDHVNPRFGYIITGIEGQKDIYVKTPDLNTALHGDRVEVELKKDRSGGNPEGRVINIIKRARSRFVGRVEVTKNYAFVVPDFKKIYQDFFIYTNDINGAQTNDKVVIEVTHWSESSDKNPEAKVVEILGKTGENEAEIHSIMAEFDLPFRFPENVIKESEQIKEGFHPEEIARRRDFRKILTFTIDPEDAKDFDDALSFQKLPNGNYEIGVHIADVTHYVRPGTQLDTDAFDRATSVYLVDRTVPMLPERLSNELCSLRPHEDKFTFAAVFEMNEKGKVLKEWYGRTIIHSDHRFSYEGAQEVIESRKGQFAEELRILNTIALALRKERLGKGAVNFETTEVKFKLDAKGKPLAVIPKIRKDAHKLIEEFMLLANKGVATFIYNLKKGGDKNTFVYRTHDFPDPDRVEDFAKFARQFGHKLQVDEKTISRSLNALMDEIEGKPEQNVLQQLAVRAMAKAKYTTDAKGHFGLAFQHYTHFTSPIRRYPDMMVHRMLQHYLDGGKAFNKTEFEQKCVHSSEREKRAADAERASIKYKQVEFMSMAENKLYEGIVSGVTDFGIFVEIIETKCEGMARLADMKDDYYEYDEKNFRVIGRRRKKVYRLGDKVSVWIKKTDVDRRLIDLSFDNPGDNRFDPNDEEFFSPKKSWKK